MSWIPLLAHEPVIERLRRAMARGRLGQSFLFVGSPGIGKRRAAQHLAQGLLCERNRPASLDPCGLCAGCKQVESDSHPDYFTVAKPEEMNDLPIESIRDLGERLSLKPARGGYKIAVVDDADLMNEASANCFLKTLEEPPPRSLLILLASAVETQLLTIVSRCQVLRFRDLTADEVATLLTRLDPQLSPEEAHRLAQWSGGSVSRALELASDDWRTLRGSLMSRLGSRRIDPLSLSEETLAFIDAAGSHAAAKRTRARQAIALVADFYRKALFFQQAPERMPDLDETDRQAIAAAAHAFSPEILVDVIERCLQADYHLARSLHQQLAIECWLDDLAQIAAGIYVPAIGFG